MPFHIIPRSCDFMTVLSMPAGKIRWRTCNKVELFSESQVCKYLFGMQLLDYETYKCHSGRHRTYIEINYALSRKTEMCGIHIENHMICVSNQMSLRCLLYLQHSSGKSFVYSGRENWYLVKTTTNGAFALSKDKPWLHSRQKCWHAIHFQQLACWSKV